MNLQSEKSAISMSTQGASANDELGEALLPSEAGRSRMNTAQCLRLDEADEAVMNEDTNNLTAVHQWRRDHANTAAHKLDETERKLMASYESLDYDTVRSEQWSLRQLQCEVDGVPSLLGCAVARSNSC